MKWYEILIQGRYTDYFSGAVKDIENDEIFNEFRDVIYGMTMAQNFKGFTEKNFEELLEDKSEHMLIGFKNFRKACPQGCGLFADIWKTLPKDEEYTPEELSAQQLAVLIMYPFWQRMGQSYEVQFAESGKLSEYLLLLKEKHKNNLLL